MKALIDLAVRARESAYAPYSNHPVGAAILTESGELFSGCNVENAAYPEGVCAEAGAISAMILAGEKQIQDVVIAGPGEHLCTPCGGCRQKIREFSTSKTQIHVVSRSGKINSFLFDELLPESFGPDCLDV
ncbi:MAG: cytidine deaminase [Proteobacteria bacterium]|nr:cytidine deaminase [Pseudomonadota bacterium]